MTSFQQGNVNLVDLIEVMNSDHELDERESAEFVAVLKTTLKAFLFYPRPTDEFPYHDELPGIVDAEA